MKKFHWLIAIFLALLFAACSGPTQLTATPQPAGKQPPPSPGNVSSTDRWSEIVAAAKKEGRLVIYGAAGPEMRQQVTDAFFKAHGIQIDWVLGRASESVQRIMTERRGGIHYTDVLTDSTASAMAFLKPAGALKPMEPDLVLPDVKDTGKWFQGRHWWLDPERTHMAYAASPIPPLAVNSDLVKKGEIQSYRDLLAPKWTGIMVMDDPTIGSSGNTWTTAVGYKIMGDDYLRELVKQKPLILRNQRQEIEWVARGKNPLLIGPSTGEYTEMKRSGAPIEVVVPKEGAWLSQSRGGLSLLNNAPHPNAAVLYLNWVLGKEAQTIISRSEGYQSARLDVSTDHLEAFALRDPGATYHNTISVEYDAKKQEYLEKAKVIFAELIK
ncbi:MAG: extracellular solute-binding protein [Chloroflexi bacterium]|nr:extracellular solute-binding protein [Chloroflexota bacterium]